MSSKVIERKDRAVPKPKLKVVDFEPEVVVAPFAIRCGALFIDYLAVIMLPASFLLISRLSGNDGSTLINSGLNDIGWLTGSLVGFVSIFILPLATGRTIGKMATGVRIVSTDGSEPSIGRMLLRQVLATLFFPLTLGLSFFWSAISPRTRAFHDYFAGTMVIWAKRRSG